MPDGGRCGSEEGGVSSRVTRMRPPRVRASSRSPGCMRDCDRVRFGMHGGTRRTRGSSHETGGSGPGRMNSRGRPLFRHAQGDVPREVVVPDRPRRTRRPHHPIRATIDRRRFRGKPIFRRIADDRPDARERPRFGPLRRSGALRRIAGRAPPLDERADPLSSVPRTRGTWSGISPPIRIGRRIVVAMRRRSDPGPPCAALVGPERRTSPTTTQSRTGKTGNGSMRRCGRGSRWRARRGSSRPSPRLPRRAGRRRPPRAIARPRCRRPRRRGSGP